MAKKKELAPGEKKKPHGLCGKPGHGKNSPVIGMNGYNLEPGDHAKTVAIAMEVVNLPNIDMHDAEQVANRLSEYFGICAKHDIKPAVSGMALSLNGMDRRRLWAIANDQPLGGMGNMTNLPTDVTDTIKRAYKSLELLWEIYFQSGKLNPVTGIFLGKNHYGYVDKQEHVLAPKTTNDSDFDADSIKQRYLVDSTDSES